MYGSSAGTRLCVSGKGRPKEREGEPAAYSYSPNKTRCLSDPAVTVSKNAKSGCTTSYMASYQPCDGELELVHLQHKVDLPLAQQCAEIL